MENHTHTGRGGQIAMIAIAMVAAFAIAMALTAGSGSAASAAGGQATFQPVQSQTAPSDPPAGPEARPDRPQGEGRDGRLCPEKDRGGQGSGAGSASGDGGAATPQSAL